MLLVSAEHCAYFQTNAVVQRCCPGGVEIPCTTNAGLGIQLATASLNCEFLSVCQLSHIHKDFSYLLLTLTILP